MSRQSLWTPITVLVTGLVIIVITLVSPGLNTSARPQLQQTRTRTATATRTITRTTTITRTSTATITRTTTATTTATTTGQNPSPEETTVTTGTVTMTASTVITDTITPGITATSTVAPATMTSVPTQTAPPTALPLTVLPTPTDDFQVEAESAPSATPTATNDVICLPGSPIDITGEGPPRTPFLLYFNQRAVGGGSIGRDGRFTTPLVVGTERPGRYEVTVRVRGTTQVLRQLTCLVPELSATPPLGNSSTVP